MLFIAIILPMSHTILLKYSEILANKWSCILAINFLEDCNASIINDSTKQYMSRPQCIVFASNLKKSFTIAFFSITAIFFYHFLIFEKS